MRARSIRCRQHRMLTTSAFPPYREWFAIAYCTLAAFIDTGITLVLWVLLRKQVLSRTGSTERVVVRVSPHNRIS